MKRFISLALLIFSMPILGVAQNPTSMTSQMQNAPARKSPLSEYAGSWIGTFDGHTWLSLRLVLQGNQISGTVERPHDFQFDNNGGLKSVSQDRLTGGVENAVLQGDGLLLTVKDPGTQQTDRYLMRLTSANSADVKMVGMSVPPGMPKILPWKLNRVMANAVTPAR